MQIFYNEEENPTPIETEPELEVEAIHTSAKKSFIPSYILLAVLALLQGGLFVSSLLGDPIGVLSNSSRLATGFSFLLLLILCAVELVCYFNWHSKAKKTAECGEFLKVPSTSKFQRIILVVALIVLVYWVINFIVCGDNIQRWIGILMCIYIPAVFIIVNGTKEFLKRRKAARSVNRTITTLTSFLVSFTLMGLIVFGTFYAATNGLLTNKEDTYEHNGMIWRIHKDELPLTVEDFIEVDYDGYIKERSGNESLFLGQLEMRQRPRLDADDYTDIPQLEYTIVVVKVPALYDMCKERLIYEQEELYLIHELEYKQENATPWGANEAYRLYDSNSGASNEYLLCYDDFLVEISFSWEPTVEQMAVVGERLGQN